MDQSERYDWVIKLFYCWCDYCILYNISESIYQKSLMDEHFMSYLHQQYGIEIIRKIKHNTIEIENVNVLNENKKLLFDMKFL